MGEGYFCRYLQEFTALGTAGGIFHFRDQILLGNPDAVFVINCDVCGDLPLSEMVEFYHEKSPHACCVILTTEVNSKTPLTFTRFTLYTCIRRQGSSR